MLEIVTRVSALLLCAALVGCGDDSVPAVVRYAEPTGGLPLLGSDCDPIVPTHCGFPFPSDVYLLDDPDGRNPSGKSVRFGASTLPRADEGTSVDPRLLYGSDGFSPGQGPMTHLPGASDAGLPRPDTIASSLDPDCPTVLLDAESGERIPHWVDLDATTLMEDERTLMIRPAVRLRDQRRYLVAIRRVLGPGGAPLPPSPVFRALRDGTDHPDPSVRRRRALYGDIFGRLDKAGVSRSDLQVAWDFTTASRDNNTRALLHMRDDALATVGEAGPTYVVKKVEEDPGHGILRRLTLTMTVPLYLNFGRDWVDGDPPHHLVLGEDGLPKQSGTMDVDVLVLVPKSVETGDKHGLLQNGHGLFGSKSEGANGYLAEMASGYRWIAFAVDLFGFSGQDSKLVLAATVTNPELFQSFAERQVQGHVNQLLAMRMMMGRVAHDGIHDEAGKVLLKHPAIDPAVRAYRGDSQGGIMGITYMSTSTDVTRGLLGETGFPYGLLLHRSVDFAGFGAVIGLAYDSPLDRQLMLGLVQMMWDHSEPDGYAPYLADDPLPGTPRHAVLIHEAIGDHQVTTLGAHLLARTIGAKNLEPLNREVWGVESTAAPPPDSSVMVEYDFALPPEPLVDLPATGGCDPHDRVRDLVPSYEQQDEFFRTGVVVPRCIGPCNCDGPGSEAGCEATLEDQCSEN